MPGPGRGRIAISTKDERSITVPVPADQPETEKFADFCKLAADDGYVLLRMSQKTSGDQRDPYVIGMVLTFSKMRAG